MFSSIQDVKQDVKDNGGVLSMTMGTLIKASGTGGVRCTQNNVRKICGELDEEELGYYPPGLDTNQNTTVRIYELGSPAAVIVEAVLYPSETNDNTLRRAFLLEQVRELLCR